MPSEIRPIHIRISTLTEAEISSLRLIFSGEKESLIITPEPSGRTMLIAGQHEQHLEEVMTFLKKNGASVKVLAAEIAYRETVRKSARVDYTHKRRFGEQWQFARVVLEISPSEQNAGFVFENQVAESVLPARFIPGVEKGLSTVLERGPLIGAPIFGLRVSLVEAAWHNTDSTSEAFEIATRAAMRNNDNSMFWTVAEPIMRLSVELPVQYVSTVIKDMHRRRGRLVETQQANEVARMVALVPLSNLFGYDLQINKMTKGLATFDMLFETYEPVSAPDEDPDHFPPAIGMRA